jgi:hypothetical protein
MSLFIYVSSKSVVIQKYKLEFPFIPPPENISKTALGAYQLLRNSVFMQTESNRAEQQEVIDLIKAYGQALYQSIIPDSLRNQIYNEGGIFIFAMDLKLINLPWELLHDSRNFFNLTQGVVRINYSSQQLLSTPDLKEKATIQISLNAYTPIIDQNSDSSTPLTLHKGIDFINQVELLSRGNLANNPNISIACNGNTSKQTLLYEFEKEPDLLMFTGYDYPDGWILKDNDSDQNKNISFYDSEIQHHLSAAIARGLRILILNSSDLLENSKQFINDPISKYFDIGIPYIISINGRVSQKRFRDYFQKLINNLAHGESILKAHRFAINYIQSALPLSWDWSWIQLHINKSLLENNNETPFAPFRLINDHEKKTNSDQAQELTFSTCRRFGGNHARFIEIQKKLNQPDPNKILLLLSSKGSLVEEYLYEYFRRFRAHQEIQLEVLYYKRWGYHQPEKHNIPKTIVKQFAFLFQEKTVLDYFDQSYRVIYSTDDINNQHKFLIILYPPDRIDSELDNWLLSKQKKGYRIILISSRKIITRLSTNIVNTNTMDIEDIRNNFEDFLPEEWVDLVKKIVPTHMKNLSLLRMARNTNNSQLFDLFSTVTDVKALWKASFKTILPELSSLKLKILLILFFLRTRVSASYLKMLTQTKKLGDEIQYLYRLGLVEADYSFRNFWMPYQINTQLKSHQLIPKEQLKRYCEEIIQNQIFILNQNRIPNLMEIIGFQYNVTHLAELGSPEAATQRYLQYLRKSLQFKLGYNRFFLQGVSHCLEFAYLSGDRKTIQKTIITIIDILDQLSHKEALNLYEWLLKGEEKARNWLMVAEVQVKMAEIYARRKQPEKAIGLITSAIQLNKDIKNFSNRYRNIITIALLLLDLEEYDQLQNLLIQQNFNFNKLNKEDVQKLWLIDGHILYHEKKYSEALESLTKFTEYTELNISVNLFAKTYLLLAEMYQQGNQPEKSNQFWSKAAVYLESLDDIQHASQLHEKLWEYHYKSGDYQKAAKHLERVYEAQKQIGTKEKIKELANLLGGIYYKLGDRNNSTKYYKISQEDLS